MATRNLRQGTLKIKDGTTPTPNELTIPVAEGNLSWTEVDEAPVIKNRGALYGFASPMQEAVEITWTMLFEEYRGKTSTGAVPSPVDALKKRGNALAWLSTLSDSPYCVDLEFTIAKPENPSASEQNEVLTFADFHCDRIVASEGEEANTVEITGKALITYPASARS